MTESSAMYNGRDFPIITVEIVVRDVIAIISYEPLLRNSRGAVRMKTYYFEMETEKEQNLFFSLCSLEDLNTLHDICEMLDCEITDVVEFVRSEEKE